jgi:thioredoxin-related protein
MGQCRGVHGYMVMILQQEKCRYCTTAMVRIQEEEEEEEVVSHR